MSIKSKQVAAVTTLVVVIVAILSVYHVATLARMSLRRRPRAADALARPIFQRAREVVPPPARSRTQPFSEDGGIRSILYSGIGYRPTSPMRRSSILDGVVSRTGFGNRGRQSARGAEDFDALLDAGAVEQLRAIYSDGGRSRRGSRCCLRRQFGSIRDRHLYRCWSGASCGGVQSGCRSVVAALIISSFFAMLLSHWMLRPIHVIQSGLTRLGRGELDVSLDLPERGVPRPRQLLRGRQRAALCRPRRSALPRGGEPTSSRSWKISRTRWRSSRRTASDFHQCRDAALLPPSARDASRLTAR